MSEPCISPMGEKLSNINISLLVFTMLLTHITCNDYAMFHIMFAKHHDVIILNKQFY